MRNTYVSADGLCQASVMPDFLGDGGHLLTFVGTQKGHRGKGLARGVMEQIRVDLENEGGTMVLSVEPDGIRMDRENPEVVRLVRWYEDLSYTLIADSEERLGIPMAMYLSYDENPNRIVREMTDTDNPATQNGHHEKSEESMQSQEAADLNLPLPNMSVGAISRWHTDAGAVVRDSDKVYFYPGSDRGEHSCEIPDPEALILALRAATLEARS